MGSDEPAVRQPPNAQAIAGRAIALAALCCRGFTDSGENDPGRELYNAILAWFESARLDRYLHADELRAFRGPPGTMDPKLSLSLTWECEGLCVFAWALRLINLPRHDEQVDPQEIASTVGLFDQDPRQLIEGAELRSSEELSAYRELIYATQVRMKTHLRGRPPFEFIDHLDTAWLETLSIDASGLLSRDDLVIQGQTIRDTAPDVLSPLFWAVCQRHRAAIWLVGDAPNHWDARPDI
jgi:hypothetical protein